MEAQTQYAKCPDGTHIAYQIVGGGPVDLLAFPAGPVIPLDAVDDEPALARFHRRLASFSRLVRFDPRGLGLSDPVSPFTPPTIEDWVQDAIAVLDAVGSERAALFAASHAKTALSLAATHPERVSRLVLVNTSAATLEAPDVAPGDNLDSDGSAFFETDARDRGYDVLAIVAPSVARDDAFRIWWDRAGNRGASPAMAQVILQMLFAVDVRDALSSITAPTLVLHRQSLQFIPAHHGRYMADHIPDARYVELPGADNLFWVGDTDGMLDEIEEFLTGVRQGADRERVLATVLFTDIVGSTAQATQLGDRAWHELLDRYRATVRRHLHRFQGREVNTRGDDFLATFDGPARAIRCAMALTEAADALGVAVRTGLHTGEVERIGEDIGGIAVHIGARVAAIAAGGTVWVSRTVVDLVAGSGIEFEDRGEHDLKGVPGTWRLFSVSP